MMTDIVERLRIRAQWHKQMDLHLDNGPKAWIADRCLEDSGAMENAAGIIDAARLFVDQIEGEDGLSNAELDTLCGILHGRKDIIDSVFSRALAAQEGE